MNREEIEEKARLIVEGLNADYYYDDNPLYRKADVMYACMQMAEWVQEQCEAEADKVYNRQAMEIAELSSQLSKVRHEDDVKIGEMTIEIGRLREQVSELTEQLDASHVFCEGVKEHYINKAQKWLSEQCVGDDTYVFTEYDFIKAIKGE